MRALAAGGPPCEILAWDTEFFGRRIARAPGGRVDPARLEVMEAWCRERRVECLYLLAHAGDRRTLATLHGTGFRLVDVRLAFERGLARDEVGRSSAPEGVRPATDDDTDVLAALARELHSDSRFFFDPGFPDERCRDLFETWMRRSLAGWADLVLVGAGPDGAPAGYTTCHLEADGLARIGLVGVAAPARGLGLGRRLVEGALASLGERGAERVEVVTQARNRAAQRLYQRCGFVTREAGLWYHRWFTAAGDA